MEVVKINIRLETERLILRDLQTKDAPILAELIAPLNVSRYLAVVPHPYALSDAEGFVSKVMEEQAKEPRNGYDLAITLKPECNA